MFAVGTALRMPSGPEEPYLTYIAANVRRRRERLGISQEKFAETAGFDPRFFRFIEQSKKDISVTSLVRLAKVLGCEPAALLRPTQAVQRKPGRPRSRRRNKPV